ncbi:MAG: histidine phosphatase family protein [Chitinophagaceae bacterium]
MKVLLLIRHAKSSWDDVTISDFNRTLNARGVKNADEMAARLTSKIKKIDSFISSPAIRAKTTAEKFAAAYNVSKDDIVFEKGLYHPQEAFFGEVISKTDNAFNTIAIFSHNPAITEYANTLTVMLQTDNIPTCGIFAVKANTDDWQSFSSTTKELLFYDYPKLHNS